MGKPTRTIAIEEHILTSDFSFKTREWADLEARMRDVDRRLGEMDRNGIDMHVLSLSSPGVHRDADADLARGRAARANDEIAEVVAAHSTRFAFFANVALQDPASAADELERSVVHLGARGAMLNHHTNGEFLDADKFDPFWERVEALDVPVYIHPASALEEPAVTRGYAGLGAAMWGWSHEVGAHALRLVLSGLFDRRPSVKVILGHMGETLPFCLWRIDSRYAIWPGKIELQKNPSDYIRNNFYFTTSGTFDQNALNCALATMGADHILFAIDYPYEQTDEAVTFLSEAKISREDLEKIAHANAELLLDLNRAKTQSAQFENPLP